MSNIWEKVPLEDYEKHMSHQTVGQQQLLSKLTREYLERLTPKTTMFLGVSGGNGLEHIDNTITDKVYGIDINNEYLLKTKIRFENRIADLELINIDISATSTKIARVDFIWAALILEYVEMGDCFKFIINNIQDNGHVVVTIQVNNGVSAISKTGVQTVKMVGQIFKPVDSKDLLILADRYGFAVIQHEENLLPNGKILETFCLKKRV
jgi:Methyltransferase domain